MTERGFDEPLLALLRATGYEHVHLVHGAQEFGKDVIAQRDGEQWAFQSKAGNISQGSWGQMTGQLDQLRTSDLSGHDFRTDLPRRPVLVCTGKLSGNASMLAKEYQERARDRDEPVLEIWNKDTLVGKLSGNPDSVLRGSVDGQLLGLLGAIEQDSIGISQIEPFSERWTQWEIPRRSGLGIIEAAVSCDRLRVGQRLDLACQLALCAVRAGWAGIDEPPAAAVADAAGGLFETYARAIWEACDEGLLEEDALVRGGGVGSWATYQVQCVRIAEFVALLALRVRDSDPDLAGEIATWLSRFVASQPGTARPLGDRYAVSLVPVAIVLAADHRDALHGLLHRATVWLCDRYEHGELGLADVDANPDDEIARVFGGPFDHIVLKKRRTSQLAGVLLDLAAISGSADLYGDIRNDTLAVGLYPTVLLPAEGPDRFLRTGLSNRWDFNADYAEELSTDAPAAPHLAGVEAQAIPDNRWWDYLALSAALRDRHFPAAIAAAIETT